MGTTTASRKTPPYAGGRRSGMHATATFAMILALLTAACGATASPAPSTPPEGQTPGASATVPSQEPASAEPSPSSRCPTQGGKLTMARSADVGQFDPIGVQSNPSLWVNPLVYQGLVRTKKDASGVEPGLAEAWEIGADAKTFTFHLRPDLKFGNGSSLTANDVVYSVRRAIDDPDSVIAGNFTSGLQITAPDDRTVVVTVPNPAPAMLDEQLGTWPIYPAGSGKELSDKPIGAGPFVLAAWEKGKTVVLKRNPYYWDQPYPCLDEVDLVVVPDANTQALQLQAGQVDVAQEIPLNQIETLKASPGVTVQVAPTMATEEIRMNLDGTMPEFQDLNVRQAMNYAIDKQAIIDTVTFGTGAIATSALPNTKWVDKSQAPYDYNVDKASQLMAASKYPKGFTASMLIASGDPVETAIATIVKSQLAEIGITVNIQQAELATKFDLLHKQDYQLELANMSSDFVDPGVIWHFCCAGDPNFLDSAWTSYRNSEASSLFEQSGIEVDPVKREGLFMQMQKIVWNDAARIFLYFIQSATGVRSNVMGFQVMPTRAYRLEEVYKTQ